MAPRWITTKAAVLIERTAELGMTLDQAAAEAIIQDRLRAVAAAMRITEATARRYLDDDTFGELAVTMVASFVEEQPGLDLAGADPDTTIEPPLAALAVTALAEATLVHLANPDRVGTGLVGECVGMLSIHGTRLYQSSGHDVVAVSRAWLRRAARYLETAADTLGSGGDLGTPTDVEPSRIATSFRADAQLLRAAARTR